MSEKGLLDGLVTRVEELERRIRSLETPVPGTELTAEHVRDLIDAAVLAPVPSKAISRAAESIADRHTETIRGLATEASTARAQVTELERKHAHAFDQWAAAVERITELKDQLAETAGNADQPRSKAWERRFEKVAEWFATDAPTFERSAREVLNRVLREVRAEYPVDRGDGAAVIEEALRVAHRSGYHRLERPVGGVELDPTYGELERHLADRRKQLERAGEDLAGLAEENEGLRRELTIQERALRRACEEGLKAELGARREWSPEVLKVELERLDQRAGERAEAFLAKAILWEAGGGESEVGDPNPTYEELDAVLRDRTQELDALKPERDRLARALEEVDRLLADVLTYDLSNPVRADVLAARTVVRTALNPD
jgi:chromosome segregation ATPase